MAYETSYDAGLKPFSHDKHRGKWASPMDFFFACLGHAFRIDTMFVLPSVIFQDFGVYVLIPYLIVMLVCTIPIVFMQSFLGQFSSTGFISVFRIAPLFKGIGYVSLAINLTTLTYCSMFAATPLFFFVNSLRPTLPWCCAGNVTAALNSTGTSEDFHIETPSLDFFLEHLNLSKYGYVKAEVSFSWSLLLCSLVIWIIVWMVLRKSTETIGRIIRYSTIVMVAVLGLCVIRFGFLPGALNGSRQLLKSRHYIATAIHLIPLMALSGLGPGWGSILTMASFNNFKNDITKQTWILCLGQFGLMVLGALSWIFIENFLIGLHTEQHYLPYMSREWMQFMSVPTALSYIEMPNFWSLLYFGVLTLGAVNLLIVQVFSVLTALFDEYERLREIRKVVIRRTIGFLALGSLLFSSNYGFSSFVLLSKYSVITQIFLNLMLLLIVLWIYGRERLQRDLNFMISRTYSTWMVYIVRFVAPIVLLFSLFIGLFAILLETHFTFVMLIIATILILLPWLLVPGFCIFKIMHTTGLLGRRFKRSLRPTDWYPVDPVEKQRYEDTFSSSKVSHPLTETIESSA